MRELKSWNMFSFTNVQMYTANNKEGGNVRIEKSYKKLSCMIKFLL